MVLNKKNAKKVRTVESMFEKKYRYQQELIQIATKLWSEYAFKRVETAAILPTKGNRKFFKKDETLVNLETAKASFVLRPNLSFGLGVNYVDWVKLNPTSLFKSWQLGEVYSLEKGSVSTQWRLGLDIWGGTNPVVEAELFSVVALFLQKLGLKPQIMINNVGNKESKLQYKQQLTNYFKSNSKYISNSLTPYITKDPQRILAAKLPALQPVIAEAPIAVDHLDDLSKKHFVKVLEYLGELQLSYTIDNLLLDDTNYQYQTLFSIGVVNKRDQFIKLFSGGRSNLLSVLTDQEVAVCAGSFDLAALVQKFVATKKELKDRKPVQIYIAQLGDQSRQKSLVLFEKLRKSGLVVANNFSKNGLRDQLKMAEKNKVDYCLILGQKEIMDGTVLIRDMENGMQETVNEKLIVDVLKKRFKKKVAKK